MDIYNYTDDGIFTVATKAKTNPREKGKYLIPRNATTIAPPDDPGKNRVRIFKNGGWSIVNDYRGTVVWSKETGQATKVTVIGNLPDDITDKECLDPHQFRWDALKGDWVPVMDRVREASKLVIDTTAENLRNQCVTPGSGQAQAYVLKYQEAYAYLADANPDPQNYVMLTAEVGITGPTLAEVATVIKTNGDAWKSFGAGIERSRLEAKAAVDLANTPEEAWRIVYSIAWPIVP